MGYSEFDEYESGPYGAVIPAGGLPPEYADAYGEPADTAPQAQPGEGLPADVLASLELPGRAEQPELPIKAAGDQTPERDMIEGFKLDLPRGGWVQFGSVLDVSGGLRKQIITKINILAKRSQDGKATAMEAVAVDTEVTSKLLAAIVETWSYDAPLPVTPHSLDQLPGLVVDRIGNVAADYMKMLISRAGGNQGSETDPQSPQRPSAG